MTDETAAASFVPKPIPPIVDSLGRTIGMRKMTGGARARAMRAAGRDANEYYISMAIIAASITQVGDKQFTFPTSPQQIEGILDALGDEGMEVAATALGEQMTSAGTVQKDMVEAAKN